MTTVLGMAQEHQNDAFPGQGSYYHLLNLTFV